LSLCGPVMDWRPVQGVPRLSPDDRWDRLQPPRDPTVGLSGYRKWMDLEGMSIRHFGDGTISSAFIMASPVYPILTIITKTAVKLLFQYYENTLGSYQCDH